MSKANWLVKPEESINEQPPVLVVNFRVNLGDVGSYQDRRVAQILRRNGDCVTDCGFVRRREKDIIPKRISSSVRGCANRQGSNGERRDRENEANSPKVDKLGKMSSDIIIASE